jgi:diguanylate cyclase (GGDEF)-like protein
MKVTTPQPAAPLARTKAVQPAGTARAPKGTEAVEANQSVLGIPPEDLTPRVQEALLTLLTEVEQLRKELDRAQTRIEELEKLADTDPLSEIPNRRAFVRELARAMSYSERYNVPTALLFFDVNGLKQINDSLGHLGGDAALVHVANILYENVRTSDMVGRLGGDEFAVVLPNATEDQAQLKATQLAELISASDVEFQGQRFKVGAAVGVYAFRPGETPMQVLERADAEMYRRKREAKARSK